jgi:hypothetical protein
MSSQKDIVNKIIPADDLYWDDTENKFIALSDDDIDSIITACVDNSITEESEILAVMNWCTNVRVGQLLMKNFLGGSIAIQTIDNDGEPVFVSNPNGNI